MEIIIIPTSELTSDNVPQVTELDKMVPFALSFAGYKYAGGETAAWERLQSLPVKVKPDGLVDLDLWSIDDVRLDLFLEQRAARMSAQEDREAGGSFVRHAAFIVAYLRHRLFGEDRGPTS